MNKKLIYPTLLLSYPLLGFADTSDVLSETVADELLSMSLEDMMNLQVQTASKVAEKLGEIPASVVLLTRQEIQRYGYTTLEEILQHISGVYQIDYYGAGGPTYGIRGYVSTSGSNRSVIILVNGVNQLFDYDASYSLPAVPVEAIDRIEIVRGPLSVIYGNGAFFGVINILTNEHPQEPGVASRVSVLGGTRSTSRWFGRTSYTGANGNLVFNATTYQTAGLDVPYRQLESQPMGMEGDLTTDRRMENTNTYVGLAGNYRNFSFDLTHSQSDSEGYFSRPTIGPGTMRKVDTTHLQVGYQQSFSEQVSLTSKLTYANSDLHINYDGVTPGLADLGNIQDMTTTAYEGEVNLLWTPETTLEWSNGLYYRQVPKVSSYLDIPSFPIPSLHQSTQRLQSGEALVTRAWFSQLNYYPSSRWKWVAGLRLEQTLGYTAFAEAGGPTPAYQQVTPHYDDQDLAVIPRLAVIYTPNEKHIFKWLYGKAINSPSFGQNTSTRLTSALPPLEAEEIETQEFDYLTYLSPRYLLSVNLFHNRLQNLLTRVIALTAAGQYLSFLGNGGEWTTNGIELSLQAQPTEELQLELGITYQQTEDRQNPDQEVSYSPPWLGQLKVSYQWTPDMTVGLTGYYVSTMESYWDPTLTNPDGSFGRRIGAAGEDYLIMNANLRFENWLTQGTFANLHLYNLFDQEIHYPTFTINNWADKGTFGRGRSVMATVGYEF